MTASARKRLVGSAVCLALGATLLVGCRTRLYDYPIGGGEGLGTAGSPPAGGTDGGVTHDGGGVTHDGGGVTHDGGVAQDRGVAQDGGPADGGTDGGTDGGIPGTPTF